MYNIIYTDTEVIAIIPTDPNAVTYKADTHYEIVGETAQNSGRMLTALGIDVSSINALLTEGIK